MSDEKKPIVFSSSTLAPVGVLVLTGVSVLSAALWLNTKLSNLEHGQNSLGANQARAEERLDRIEVKLDSQFLTEDRFSGWIELFEAENKGTLVVPKLKEK